MMVECALPPVTVATVSRRSTFIERCLVSVRDQDYAGDREHIVLVDDLRDVHDAWLSFRSDFDFSLRLVPREGSHRPWQSRVASLRNHAVQEARHGFIAFLDDDNAWEHDHLSSLMACMLGRDQPHAVHSHRKIFESDGAPFLRDELPWGPAAPDRRRIFEDYVRLGIMSRGSNVFRDRVKMPHTAVDMGAWLLPRDLLLRCPLDARLAGRLDHSFLPTGEDEILERDLVNLGGPITCTARATLHYYLGGSTNQQLQNR